MCIRDRFTGKIVDGTMNTVTVESPADGRRVTFTTEDADMQEACLLYTSSAARTDQNGSSRPKPNQQLPSLGL